MNKFLWVIGAFILITLISPLKIANDIKAAKADYIFWEEACIKEYQESQELYIFIDLTKCKLYFFRERELVKKYNVAIGTRENPSPIGIFRVVEKGKWGKGFGGRWMGMNVPWGVYGIHGTTKPGSIGRAASHGCIRMRNGDAAELYDMVRHGTVVEIYGGPFGSFGKGFRELRPGDTGADVLEVQRIMKLKGYYNGYLSGYYGVLMERSLNRFQKQNMLPISNVINKGIYDRLGIILDE